MRCLLVSDLHYTLKQLDWVLSRADAFDVVVIAGDHLDIGSAVSIQAQIAVILAYLKRLSAKTKVVVCSGNHDLDARSPSGEKYAGWIARSRPLGIPADEDSLEIDDTLFTVCPWWDGPESCKEVGRQLELDSLKPKGRWIWVYHAPPDGSPTSWGGRQHYGDAQLLEWIERYSPDMVLSGHIHQSPFKQGGSWADRNGKTWIFNPGRQIGPCPTHIVLDTDRHTAVWVSLAGAEAVRLDKPLLRPIPELRELPDWLK